MVPWPVITKIKLRKLGYRLVYGVQDDILMVMVMAVDKREDSAVYQSAMARISELISAFAKVTPKRH
jgi:mRNA interferase RelE/StbE